MVSRTLNIRSYHEGSVGGSHVDARQVSERESVPYVVPGCVEFAGEAREILRALLQSPHLRFKSVNPGVGLKTASL